MVRGHITREGPSWALDGEGTHYKEGPSWALDGEGTHHKEGPSWAMDAEGTHYKEGPSWALEHITYQTMDVFLLNFKSQCTHT